MSDDRPEFGPRGYLPPRAARRARKILLREPMGLGWPLAAVVAMLVLAAVGAIWWLRSGPPGPPFVAVGPLAAIPAGTAGITEFQDGPPVLVVRAGGRFRVFADPGVPVRYCDESRRLESPSGRVWTLDGIHTGAVEGSSLHAVPAIVHNGELYVDATDPAAAPAAGSSGGETPMCAAGAS